MKLIFVILLCSVFFLSCIFPYIEKPNNTFKTLINKPRCNNSPKLNFNGIYSYQLESSDYNIGINYKNGTPTKFIDTPFVNKPVFFCANGLLAFSNSLWLDSLGYLDANKKFGTQKKSHLNNWGVYDISKDTIKAIIYIFSYDAGNPMFQSNFEGVIKNSDSILNWHLVPPYHKILLKKKNKFQFDFFTTPQNLYFKKVPIDSIINSSEAWINEFNK